MASPTSILRPGDRTPKREPRLPYSKSRADGTAPGKSEPPHAARLARTGTRKRLLQAGQVRGGG